MLQNDVAYRTVNICRTLLIQVQLLLMRLSIFVSSFFPAPLSEFVLENQVIFAIRELTCGE